MCWILVVVWILLLLNTLQCAQLPFTSYEIASDTETYMINTSVYNNITCPQCTELICNSTICHVIITWSQSPYSNTMTIDASTSDELILHCLNQTACKDLIITKGPKIAANIKCEQKQSCGDADFNVTNTFYVDLNCSNSYTAGSAADGACLRVKLRAESAQNVTVFCAKFSCSYSKLFVNNVTNSVKIDANHYGLNNAEIYGYYAENIFAVNCNKWFSCSAAEIYCPYTSYASCNINCGSDQFSCRSVKVFVENKLYKHLSIDCDDNDEDSCPYAKIYCSDTSTTSYNQLKYNSAELKWECGSFNCCPYGIAGSYICPANKSCNIDCSTNADNNCMNWNIDATYATSLNINCSSSTASGYGCQNAVIQCPSVTMNECNIMCDEEYSCQYTSIGTYNVEMQTLTIDCSGHYGCASSDILLSFQSVNVLDMIFGNYSRYGANIAFSNGISLINTFNLNCVDINACSFGSFVFDFDMKTFNMNCVGTYSCYNGYYSASSVSESAVISCNDNNSCNKANIELNLVNAADVIINCQNLNISGSQFDSSCGNATFNIKSSSQPTGNDHIVSATCNKWDCVYTRFNLVNVSQSTINCNEENSCIHFDLLATETKLLELNCGAKYGCYEANIYCPYNAENICNIKCNNDPFSCYNTDISVDELFSMNYLNITCSNSDTNKACHDVEIFCDETNGIYSNLYFDVGYDEYKCNVSGSKCCPFIYTSEPTTITPTTSTVINSITFSSSSTIISTVSNNYDNNKSNNDNTIWRYITIAICGFGAIIINVMIIIIIIFCIKRRDKKNKLSVEMEMGAIAVSDTSPTNDNGIDGMYKVISASGQQSYDNEDEEKRETEPSVDKMKTLDSELLYNADDIQPIPTTSDNDMAEENGENKEPMMDKMNTTDSELLYNDIPRQLTQTEGKTQATTATNIALKNNNSQILETLYENIVNDANDYEWIENTLKKLDEIEWKRYSNNFKKNKITDLRLKHIKFDDKDVWKELIPEIGIRYEFKELLKNNKNIVINIHRQTTGDV